MSGGMAENEVEVGNSQLFFKASLVAEDRDMETSRGLTNRNDEGRVPNRSGVPSHHVTAVARPLRAIRLASSFLFLTILGKDCKGLQYLSINSWSALLE